MKLLIIYLISNFFYKNVALKCVNVLIYQIIAISLRSIKDNPPVLYKFHFIIIKTQ